jgi:hypothetical protein
MTDDKIKRLRADADQARFEYEHAMTANRHARDTAVAEAWASFKEAQARAWTTYRAVAEKYEAAVDEVLKRPAAPPERNLSDEGFVDFEQIEAQLKSDDE